MNYLPMLFSYAIKAMYIIVSGYCFTICIFHLPTEYKKEKKLQCFIYICVGLVAIALYSRVFS